MNLSGLHRKFVLNGRDTMDPTKVTGPTQLLSLGYLWQSVPGIDTDGVSTANADEGHQTWIYVKADEDIDQWDIVQQKDGEKTILVNKADGTVTPKVIGVAQYDIASGEYGFVMCYGITKVTDFGGAAPLLDGAIFVAAAGVGNEGEAASPPGAPTGADAAKSLGYVIDAATSIVKITLFRG
jgi:hypothetical protein